MTNMARTLPPGVNEMREETIRERMKQEELARAERMKKVDRAARLVTMLDEPVGQDLFEILSDLRKTVCYEPTAFFCSRAGVDGQPIFEVNPSMVARSAGFIEAIDAISSILDAQRELIKRESAKNGV